MNLSRLRWCILCALLLAVPLCGCQRVSKWLEGEPEGHRTYRVANELFDGQNFAEAAVAYRAWLADYRDEQDVMRPMVLYRLAESCRKMRDYEGAEASYVRLIKLYGDSPEANVKKLVGLAKLRLDDITPEKPPAPAKPAGK